MEAPDPGMNRLFTFLREDYRKLAFCKKKGDIIVCKENRIYCIPLQDK
jgi:hypothetical protein